MAAKKATNTKGKSTAKKSSGSKSRAASSRSANSVQKRRLNPQIKAILLCAVGIIMLARVLIPGGNLWSDIHHFLFGVFGVCSLLVPLVFIYLGIMTAKEKQMAHKGAKIALSAVLVLFVATLIYLLGKTDHNLGNSYFSALGAAYQYSFNLGTNQSSSLCGMIGAIFGYPLRAWFGTTPSVIVSLLWISPT